MNYYANGGLASAAQHLRSKGRGPDTELVHMSPNELKGLHAIAKAAGGGLTINPHTGLPEAKFLDKLLPMVAGAALTYFSGGALAPWASALMVGGVQAARTGDIKEGLMAGLGAYGGAGLTAGLTTAGVEAGKTAAMEAGVESARNATIQNPELWGSVGSEGASPLSQGVLQAGSKMTPEMASAALPDAANAAYQQGYTQSMGGTGTQLGRGIASLGTEAGRSAAYAAIPQGTLPGIASAGMAAASEYEQDKMQGPQTTEDEYDKRLKSYRLAENYQPYAPQQPNPYYRPTGLGYAAEGGSTMDIALAAGGRFDDEPMGGDDGVSGYAGGGHLGMSADIPAVGLYRDADPDTAKKDALTAAMIRLEKARSAASMGKGSKLPKTSIKGLGDIQDTADFAKGGHLGDYSDGGRLLKGPGDGMSDHIPATIGKKQPARLADGEFVVPADVVSHLGNGSTDAGAKKLYGMMDKIRHARTGKKKQAPAVKADKYMPA